MKNPCKEWKAATMTTNASSSSSGSGGNATGGATTMMIKNKNHIKSASSSSVVNVNVLSFFKWIVLLVLASFFVLSMDYYRLTTTSGGSNYGGDVDDGGRRSLLYFDALEEQQRTDAAVSSAAANDALTGNHRELVVPSILGEREPGDTSMDVHPREEYFAGRCVTVRFRGSNRSFTVDGAIEYLAAKAAATATSTTGDNKTKTTTTKALNVGLSFVENTDRFWSLGRGYFHYFHFVEFLVVGFQELHRLSVLSSASESPPLLSSNSSITTSDGGGSSSSRGLPRQQRGLQQVPSTSTGSAGVEVRVPWMYVPHMTTGEICGITGTDRNSRGLNCLAADLVLQRSISSSVAPPNKNDSNSSVGSKSSRRSGWTRIYGLESNDAITRAIHPAFRGETKRRTIESSSSDAGPLSFTRQKQMASDYASMEEQADAVMLINRHGCPQLKLNKMWAAYMDRFPARSWHERVRKGLSHHDDPSIRSEAAAAVATSVLQARKLTAVVIPQNASSGGGGSGGGGSGGGTKKQQRLVVVCYVDRQNTERRLPDDYHAWLVGLLEDYERVAFVHLHMERYQPAEQIRLASSCDAMMGVHGNGLTHQIWMPPNRFVVEFFWNFGFHFDYYTAARIMRHRYLGLWNGAPIDARRLENLDGSLFKDLSKKRAITDGKNKKNPTRQRAKIESGKRAIRAFLDRAVDEFL